MPATRKINMVISEPAAEALEILAADYGGNKTAVINGLLTAEVKGRRQMVTTTQSTFVVREGEHAGHSISSTITDDNGNITHERSCSCGDVYRSVYDADSASLAQEGSGIWTLSPGD